MSSLVANSTAHARGGDHQFNRDPEDGDEKAIWGSKTVAGESAWLTI